MRFLMVYSIKREKFIEFKKIWMRCLEKVPKGFKLNEAFFSIGTETAYVICEADEIQPLLDFYDPIVPLTEFIRFIPIEDSLKRLRALKETGMVPARTKEVMEE